LGTEANELTREKLLQVFRYLKEFNNLRNPVTRRLDEQPLGKDVIWLRDLPPHSSVQLRQPLDMVSLDEASDESAGAEVAGSPILRVRRPDDTPPPAVPEGLADWLDGVPNHPDEQLAIKPAIDQKDEDGQESTVQFGDDPRRLRLLQEWQGKWQRWAEVERPARRARELYDRLFRLRSRMDLEGETLQLVLGDGLLVWPRDGADDINHPVLLQPIELRFEPSVPEFCLEEGEQPTEFYAALLQSVSDVQASVIRRYTQEVEAKGTHPLDGEETSLFLRRLVGELSSGGEFAGEGRPEPIPFVPRMGRDPVIFVRKRSLGFGRAIEAVLQDLADGGEAPASLALMVGVEAAPQDSVESEPSADLSWNGEDEEVLLTKPANSEQLQIARQLETHGVVLVQGPPGTGKTHTIANLLGHLLSQGKTALVTSHTSKALRVLREQVVEALQPLCVSALSDRRDELQSAIGGINERLSSNDADALEREAAKLDSERRRLLELLREQRRSLLTARSSEYEPVVVAGTEYNPTEAARLVKQHEDAQWIPGPVAHGVGLPLSDGEVESLYQSNTLLKVEDERDLALPLPDSSELPAPGEFEKLVSQHNRLARDDLGFGRELWSDVIFGFESGHLTDLCTRALESVQILSDAADWQLAAILAGARGEQHRVVWEELLGEIKRVSDEALAARSLLARHRPDVPEGRVSEETLRTIEEMLAHLERGRELRGWKYSRKAEWKAIVGSCAVRGTRPTNADHLRALHAYVRLNLARESLLHLWDGLVSRQGGPEADKLGPEPELTASNFRDAIAGYLNWWSSRWLPLEENFRKCGLLWDEFLSETPPGLSPFDDLLRLRDTVTQSLPRVVDAQVSRMESADVRSKLHSLAARLDTFQQEGVAAVPVQQFQCAARELDVESYRVAYTSLQALEARRETLETRKALLSKLEPCAENWARHIRARQGVHGQEKPPGDPKLAWLCRQLNDELERRAQLSIDAIQGQIAYLTEELQEKTAVLVDKRAWAAQIRRTSLQQRQALQGFAENLRRVGRGTSKSAPTYRAEARRLMPICQTAVPVWIMPLSQVAESFDPAENRFDVVIVDEASQADVLSVLALYMGKQAVVVGDDEQVSPDAVGVEWRRSRGLIEAELSGIPNKYLWDARGSLYALANTAFPGVIRLREHFRCVPSIIQFSNLLSYNGDIKPLRDDSQVNRRPFTVAYRVDGGECADKKNPTEARVVASLVAAALEQSEYDGATFGVISLVGDEQAREIDSLLQRYVRPAEYHEHRILCGNAAQFQGDERDVVFLSVVDSARQDGPLPIRRGEGVQPFKKRFNVAASRARDQMWVVYSLHPETDLQPGDLRRRLIEHAKDPEALCAQIASQAPRTQSPLEREVLNHLISGGYRVTSQWPVGAYHIDMVVEGGGRRLAVECDGDRWHPPEKLAEDMGRQMVLERLGWRFVRIRGSQFYRDPEIALRPVFDRLRELDIPPEAQTPRDQEGAATDERLKERVIRRATEIVQEWEHGYAHVPSPTPPTPTAIQSQDRQLPTETERYRGITGERVRTGSPPTVQRRAPIPLRRPKVEPAERPAANSARQSPTEGTAAKPVVQLPLPVKKAAKVSGDSDFDLMQYLVSAGAKIVDKRAKGGALWVLGGTELEPLMADLRSRGIRFTFMPQGGRATRNAAAWWTP